MKSEINWSIDTVALFPWRGGVHGRFLIAVWAEFNPPVEPLDWDNAARLAVRAFVFQPNDLGGVDERPSLDSNSFLGLPLTGVPASR